MNITKLIAKWKSWDKMTKKEQDTLWKKLRDRCDQVFSVRIRNRDKGNSCVTCNWPIQHNCHRIDRAWYSHRRSEDNCRGGCANCNTYRQEEHKVLFTIYQTKKFWQDWVDKQIFERNKIKPSIDKLLYIISQYS